MPELPDYMMQLQKPLVPDFQHDEHLYRRVPDTLWDEGEIQLDTIEFPDMSVTRQSLGPASSARWVGNEYLPWGVIGFEAGDIPPEIPYLGAVLYRLRPVHRPLKRNYPHSEVQVFEAKWDDPQNEIHLNKETMPGVPLEAQLEWRELLLRRCRVILKPREEPVDYA